MPQRQIHVTIKDADAPRLPDFLSSYAIIAQSLANRGVWSHLDMHCQLSRKSGSYQTIDAVAFLLAYFASGLGCGLKAFADRTRAFGPRLAALAGRRQWMTQASISRLLGSAELAEVDALCRYLLGEASQLDCLAGLNWAGPRDALGQPWHLLHWDPTVQTLRSRALPQSDDLPEPSRRGAVIGRRGYAGRKRGELIATRTTLQDSHTSAWLAVDVAAGSGSVRGQLARDLAGVAPFLQAVGAPLARCLVIVDGVHAGVPQLEESSRAGLGCITRLCDYDLLERDDVARLLGERAWLEVCDSGSGPRRFACELGHWHLGVTTPVRLIVTRCALDDEQRRRGCGRTVGEWHYEMFAATVDAHLWPAPDVVAHYYGRAAQENRYGCERREFDLERLYSHQPAGQKLACAVALWVWNLQIGLGLELVEPVAAQPRPAPRRDTAIGAAVAPEPAPSPPQTVELAADSPADPPRVELGELLAQAGFDADHWEKTHPGWRWDRQLHLPVCPTGQPLRLHQARLTPAKRLELRFRGAFSSCSACPTRQLCSTSTQRRFRREVSVNLALAGALEPWAELDSTQLASLLAHRSHTARRTRRISLLEHAPPAPFECQPSMLRPGELRQAFRQHCHHVGAAVELVEGPSRRKLPSYLAATPAQRQQRRHTYEQRSAWNRLPEGSSLVIRFEMSPAIGPPPPGLYPSTRSSA